MQLRVFLEHLAEKDLEEYVDYIAADNPSAAARFIESVETAFAQLADMPRIGVVREFRNPRLKGIRVRPIPSFEKYLIFYVLSADEVQVLRVIHGARDIPSVLGEDQ